MRTMWAQRGSRAAADATRAVNRVPTCTPTLGSAWRFLNHAERGSGAGRGCSVSGDALKAGPADLPRPGGATLC